MTPQSFRAKHLCLDQKMVYLASCSLAARTHSLNQAIATMLDDMSTKALGWHAFESYVVQARALFSQLIGADEKQIALLPNASVGAYQVASTMSWDNRDGIIFSLNEFPSIAHVWNAQKARGAACHGLQVADSQGEIYRSYGETISHRTKLVSIPYTSYLDGRLMPVKAVTGVAHEAGAKVFVDAYQAIGVEPVDVIALDCDYLVAGSMKYMMGLPGLAFLYVKAGVNDDILPQMTGWFGRKNPFEFDPLNVDYPPTATRYETGTVSVPAVYSATAGIRLLLEVGVEQIKSQVEGLVTYAAERLKQTQQLAHIPVRGEHGAIVAIRVDDVAGLEAFLTEHKVITSPRGSLLRLSFHYFNSREDVDKACDLIEQFCGIGPTEVSTRGD
ncbi:aminotransferase class V-fold PLP-dependent enzyme [Rheinheimera sp. WS51]|uniref:aminotransferase class V-fold PLP-dependent enzyme n=1 Tax=Rheinheimera sp. WS51 TaxID=3425886 RepID=UPI003D8D0585